MKDLVIAITGEITKSNFAEFEKEIIIKLDVAKAKELVTDQDFSDAKMTVKFCAKTITAINKVKKDALAETADINELFAGLDRISASLGETKKTLDKKVKTDFATKKKVIIDKGLEVYRTYVDRLVILTPELITFISLAPESFQTCVFRKSKINTIQSAVDKNLKTEMDTADSLAKDVCEKVDILAGVMKTHAQIFPDRQALLGKSCLDLKATVSSRVFTFNAEEEKKAEQAKRDDVAAQAAASATSAVSASQPPLFDKPLVKEQPVPSPGFIDSVDKFPPNGDPGFTPATPSNRGQVKDEASSAGEKSATPATPPPFGDPKEGANPAGSGAQTPATPSDIAEDFVIIIPLHCDVEWAKRLAGDILAKIKGYKEVGNIKLSRP